jgi:hypothetical protein
VLGVMASDQGGSLAPFSNFDCTPHNVVEYEVKAPGVGILSTYPMNQYVAWAGTSMAAPIVSGIAALLRTKFADKDLYSSRFIMGQIGSMGPPMSNLANAINALTNTPKPELSFLQLYSWDTSLQATNNDNDGRVDAGETIDLALVIRNHWGKGDDVTVTLDAWAQGAFQPDPYVTILTNTVNYGAIGSFNWDDNGLIFDLQNGMTGVRNPFRFAVSSDCPNDHVIPFRVTMTCRNGLDPADSTIYTFQSRFYLPVTHGRELPRFIEQDMTLSKEFYWIVPQPTLVSTGATVTITEGAQVQFSEGSYLQVEGAIAIRGTEDEPVELFPQGSWSADISGRITEVRYARIMNASISTTTLFDHCYFEGGGRHRWTGGSSSGAYISGRVVNSIFKNFNAFVAMRYLSGDACLFDMCAAETGTGEDSVFLGGYFWRGGGGLYWNTSTGLDGPTDKVSEVGVWSNKTYFAVFRGNQLAHEDDLQQAEQLARRSGGHLADITDANEHTFVSNFTRGIVGLEYGPAGWSWTSGEPLAYYPSNATFLSTTGGLQMVSSGTWSPAGPSERNYGQNRFYPFIVEVPGVRSYSEILTNLDGEQLVYLSTCKNNAYLRNWFPGKQGGIRFSTEYMGRYGRMFIGGNYWGTTSTNLIQTAISDSNNDFNYGRSIIQPVRTPTNPPVTCYPFVTDVVFSTPAVSNTLIVGVERVTFTVSFNRDHYHPVSD